MGNMYVQNFSSMKRGVGMNGHNGVNGHHDKQDSAFFLFTDDSEESQEAVRMLNSIGIAYTELNEKRDKADAGGRAPLLVTPVGPFIGVRSITAIAHSNLALLIQKETQEEE